MPASKKRKGAKKHRPIQAEPPTLLYRVVDSEVTQEELNEFQKLALISLERIRMGTYDVHCYRDINFVLKNLYVLALVFNEKEDLRLLAMMSLLSLRVIYARQRDLAGFESHGDGVRSLQHNEYLALCNVMRAAVDTYHEMASNCSREELLRARNATRKFDLVPRSEKVPDLVVITPNPGPHDPYGRRGAAWIHGEVRIGYLDKLNDKLIWRMPLTESFAVIDKPTVAMILPEDKKNA